jgi:hypothetical protein
MNGTACSEEREKPFSEYLRRLDNVLEKIGYKTSFFQVPLNEVAEKTPTTIKSEFEKDLERLVLKAEQLEQCIIL